MATNVDSTASTIIKLFADEINKQDINGLLHAQNLLYVDNILSYKKNFLFLFVIRLEQLDKSNEKLDGINRISTERYLSATKDFTKHTQTLTTMKKDLDFIFKRIKYDIINYTHLRNIFVFYRLLKVRLNKKYPESFASGKISFYFKKSSLKEIVLFFSNSNEYKRK